VRVRITGSDALTLEVHANLVARLDEVAAAPAPAEDEDEVLDAAPLALAIDVDEAEATTAAPVTP
jgi:exoribonuclease II